MTTSKPAHDHSILRAHRWVQGIAAAILASYVAWFWVLHAVPLSLTAEAWGQFGDFLGGVLNPIIAYAAFLWLTESVRLQKIELVETRRALQEAAISQGEQARHAQVSVRLSALTSLVNAITMELQIAQDELKFMTDQIARSPMHGGVRAIDGGYIAATERDEKLASLSTYIKDRLHQRLELEAQIRAVLRSYSENALTQKTLSSA
jgi:hypothetical protein